MRPWDRRTLRQLVARPPLSRVDRPVARPIGSSTRTCCATRSHAEFGCHSLIPGTTLEELIAGFEEARRAGGDFCLATHYWEVDEALKDVLLRFLDHAARVRRRAVRRRGGAVRVMTASSSDWGRKAAALYEPAYARQYRAHDDELDRRRAVPSGSAEWLRQVCASFDRPIDALDLGCGTGRYFWALRGRARARRHRRLAGDARRKRGIR